MVQSPFLTSNFVRSWKLIMDSLGTVLMEAKLRNFLRNYSSCLPRNVTFIGMMG